MAGSSSTYTHTHENYGKWGPAKRVEKVTITWVADDTDGSVPNVSVPLNGWLIKAVTNPGSPAPTDNYDIVIGDPNDSALDVVAGALADRDTATSEQVYPVVGSSATPPFLCGTHTVGISGNSVNSATGEIILYLIDG